MTWKYFFNSLLEMFGAVAFSLTFVAGCLAVAFLLERLLRALVTAERKAKETTPRNKNEGDGPDIDGGVGGAPVCP